MMPSRTRVADTLVGLLVLTVVALAVLPWLVPRIQEAARDKPDPDKDKERSFRFVKHVERPK